VGVDAAVGVAAGEPLADADGVGPGVDVGGRGGVGQLARAGLNGVGDGVGEGVLDADGAAVATYGV
jgi:hypothetical protein